MVKCYLVGKPSGCVRVICKEACWLCICREGCWLCQCCLSGSLLGVSVLSVRKPSGCVSVRKPAGCVRVICQEACWVWFMKQLYFEMLGCVATVIRYMWSVNQLLVPMVVSLLYHSPEYVN